MILAIFDALMPIVEKGGRKRERREKTIVLKREEKAIVNVKVVAEAQKAVETAVIAVETAVIAADEAESAEAEKDIAEKAAEEIEAEKAAEEERLIAAEAQNFFEQLGAEIAAEAAEEERLITAAAQNFFEELVAEIAAEAAMEAQILLWAEWWKTSKEAETFREHVFSDALILSNAEEQVAYNAWSKAEGLSVSECDYNLNCNWTRYKEEPGLLFAVTRGAQGKAVWGVQDLWLANSVCNGKGKVWGHHHWER